MVEGRFYRSNYDAAKTLGAFDSGLLEQTELDSLGEEELGGLEETMQPEHTSLWLRPHRANAREDMPG